MRTWLAGLLLACGLGSAPGEPPPAVRELPEFQAVNLDGEPRTRAHLLGRPTVMWFYPAASTPG